MAITIKANVKGTEFLQKWEKNGISFDVNMKGDALPKSRELSASISEIKSTISTIATLASSVNSLTDALGLGNYNVHIKGLTGIATSIIAIATAATGLQASLGGIALLSAGVAWVVGWLKSSKEESIKLNKETKETYKLWKEAAQLGISQALVPKLRQAREEFEDLKNTIETIRAQQKTGLIGEAEAESRIEKLTSRINALKYSVKNFVKDPEIQRGLDDLFKVVDSKMISGTEKLKEGLQKRITRAMGYFSKASFFGTDSEIRKSIRAIDTEIKDLIKSAKDFSGLEISTGGWTEYEATLKRLKAILKETKNQTTQSFNDTMDKIKFVTDLTNVSIEGVNNLADNLRKTIKGFQTGDIATGIDEMMKTINQAAIDVGDALAKTGIPYVAEIGGALSGIAKAMDGVWKFVTGWWRGANDSWAKNIAKDLEKQQKDFDKVDRQRKDAIRGIEKSLSIFEDAFRKGAISAGTYFEVLSKGKGRIKDLERGGDEATNKLRDKNREAIKDILSNLGGWNWDVEKSGHRGNKALKDLNDEIKKLREQIEKNSKLDFYASPQNLSAPLMAPSRSELENNKFSININNNLVLNPDNPESWNWLVEKIIDRIKIYNSYGRAI